MKTKISVLAAVCCLALPSLASAQSALTQEERRLLAEGMASDADAAESGTGRAGRGSSNPNVSLVLDVAGAWFGGDGAEQLGAHDPTQTGFTFRQLELHLDSNVDPFATFEADLVFLQEGVEIEEAHLTTLALPGNLQARAGVFFTRMGRLNSTHPHAWSFIDQPLVNGKFFGGEGSRGLGAELSWLVPLPWFVELSGAAHNASGCCGRSYYDETELSVEGPGDLAYTARLEQFVPLSDDWSFLVGASGQTGPNPAKSGARTDILVADLYLRWRPVSSTHGTYLALQIESMARRRQVATGQLEDFGGYASLIWGVDQNWEVGGRHELVTGLPDDPLDPEWDEDLQRSALQITWRPSHFSKLRLQSSYAQPSGAVAVMLGVEVVVGAHGAHKF
jgi:hypothetical protein